VSAQHYRPHVSIDELASRRDLVYAINELARM
jgi:hypothetical protein